MAIVPYRAACPDPAQSPGALDCAAYAEFLVLNSGTPADDDVTALSHAPLLLAIPMHRDSPRDHRPT